MKKISICVLSLLFSASSYAQQTSADAAAIPYAPKKDQQIDKDAIREAAKEGAKEGVREAATKLKGTDECPPANPKSKPDCKPKPKPKPKPAKPKPTPKPVPEAKKCPEQKSCPKCEPEVRTEVRTVEKEKLVYRDRTVTIDSAPKNTLNILVGVGPHGIVTDYYETADRKDEYAVRKEKDKSKGGLIGIQYGYRLSPSFSVTGLGLSNETFMVGGGFHW